MTISKFNAEDLFWSNAEKDKRQRRKETGETSYTPSYGLKDVKSTKKIREKIEAESKENQYNYRLKVKQKIRQKQEEDKLML